MKNRHELTHGRYRIIAGTLGGQHKAVALDPQSRKVGEALGRTGVEEAIDAMRERLDDIDSARAESRREIEGTVVASAGEYGHALSSAKLSAAEKAMLRAHAAAPKATLSLAELAAVAGYRNHRTAALRYAAIGQRIGESIGLPPPPASGKKDQPDYARIIASADPEQEAPRDDGAWCWTLHPELVEALEEHFAPA